MAGIGGLPVSLSGEPVRTVLAALNARADSARAEMGDAVCYQPTAKNGVSIVQPTTALAPGNFLGILSMDIAHGDQRNAAVVATGIAVAKFKNHASATAGTYCTPVNGQDYLTYSATPTRIVLLTDQSSGTDEHSPNEAVPPKVLLLPGSGLYSPSHVSGEAVLAGLPGAQTKLVYDATGHQIDVYLEGVNTNSFAADGSIVDNVT